MKKPITFLALLFYSFFAQSQGVNDPLIGTQQVAILPFDYAQDGNHQTIEVLEAGFFTGEYSIKNFIEEISYGKASIDGIVYPYRTNQPPLFGTGYTSCYPVDEVIINQPDVDYSIIDGLILSVHANTGSCAAGTSTFGKLPFNTIDGFFEFRRSGFRTDFYFPNDFSEITSSTVAHELIHSFGISFHSNSYIKVDGEYTIQAYGNLFDIMGLRSQASHPCSLIKQQKGWLTDNEIENVSAAGTYRIYALEKTLPGQTQALVIDLPEELDIQPNDAILFNKLYLEYRGLTGFDYRWNRNVNLSDGKTYINDDPHGLLIVGADCQLNDDFCIPVLIDTHPEPIGGVGANYLPHEASDAPLKLGETYFVDNNEISIEVVNVVEGNYIDVSINFSALSITEVSGIDTLKIYPNPASSVINIDFKEAFSFTANLYDLRGRLISSNFNSKNIDISGFTNGMYLLEISDLNSSRKIIEKIIISK